MLIFTFIGSEDDVVMVLEKNIPMDYLLMW